MTVIKNWKCIGEKNAALEHCWGIIAAKDREIARLAAERDEAIRQSQGYLNAGRDCLAQRDLTAQQFKEYVERSADDELARLADKDREIAALREAVERLLIEIEGPPPYATERRVAFARAALSASPAADPAREPYSAAEAISQRSPTPDPAEAAVDAGLAIWPTAESYDERVAVKEILAAANPHLRKDWLERFMQDDSGLPSRFAPPAPDPAEATARLERGIRERDTVIANLIAAPDPDPAEAMRAKTIDECEALLIKQAGGHHENYARNPSAFGAPLNNYAGDEILRCAALVAALKGNGEGT